MANHCVGLKYLWMDVCFHYQLGPDAMGNKSQDRRAPSSNIPRQTGKVIASTMKSTYKIFVERYRGCRFVPYRVSETKPQMVPRDLNIGETRVWL